MKPVAILLSASAAATLLGGCDPALKAPPSAGGAPGAEAIRPVARPDTLADRPPPAGARTAEAFDTTTPGERAAAVSSAPPGGGRALGTTIASLGDPAKAGLWLETPLVKAATQGRVVLAATGRTVQVELRPIDGAASAGSRISLAALRLLELPLTGLPDLTVYAD